MEALMSFYRETGDSSGLDRFNEANEEIRFTNIYYSLVDGETQLVSSTTKCREDVKRSMEQAVPGKRLLSCIVTTPDYERQMPRIMRLKEKDFHYLLGTMGLSDYVPFACSNALSFDVVPRYCKGKSRGFYASAYAKHFFGLFYVYDQERDLSMGIFWATAHIYNPFLEALSRLHPLALHPGFLLFTMAASLNTFNQCHLENIRLGVARVEARTGHAGWGNAEYQPMKGPFSELSSRMSGFASSLAAHRRSVKLCTEILESIESLGEWTGMRVTDQTSDIRRLFDSHVTIIKRRATVQGMFVELLLARVQNQITALFNLMNRGETEMSLGVARDSRTIALASKHDSTSMKTLAAVTVVFLPGTFVASLFSMSMFDWQADAKNVLTPRFWIYWVVTIPLTLATVCAWYVWINRKAAIIRSKEEKAVEYLGGIRDENLLGPTLDFTRSNFKER